ncbi:MAG: saccharopine dehydrogenase family protein [Candidatus Hodarchaeota archaeon]
MRILGLGCAGDMGRMAVAILLEFPSVSSITIADINIDLATTFVKMVNSPKLFAVQIDINQKDQLLDLISHHDVVINTIGPFYKFELTILKAILEAKKPYLDICDDWKPTIEALELDDKAKTAGIAAVIGIGASPGITNLMAVYACSKLDEIDDLITAWGEWISIKQGEKPKYYIKPKELKENLETKIKVANAANVHLLYETLEKIPTFKNGKMIEIEPLTETNPFSFPGFKEMYACHIGHPEPVTLPRIIRAKSVSNIMYVGETFTEFIRECRRNIQDNKMTIQETAISLDKKARELTKRALMGRGPLREYLGGPPNLSVIAIGIKNGKRKKVAVALGHNPYGYMAGLTGVPLAIATIMLIEGKIKKRGVLTPEEAFPDPMEFFNKMAPYCGKNLSGEDILIIREVDI